MIQPTGGTKRRVLAKIGNLEPRELGRPLTDGRREHRLVVVTDEDHFLDGGDFGDGGERVVDQAVAGDFKEGL